MNGFQTITLTGGQTNRQSVSAGAEIRLQINTSAASNPTMSSTFTADFHNAYAVPVLQFVGGGRFLISQRRRR
jgi:hypothetical protein